MVKFKRFPKLYEGTNISVVINSEELRNDRGSYIALTLVIHKKKQMKEMVVMIYAVLVHLSLNIGSNSNKNATVRLQKKMGN